MREKVARPSCHPAHLGECAGPRVSYQVNAKSMFNEVDEDASNTITWDEFLKFWQNVVGSGYPQEDVEEEVDMMLEGGSWVDFNDGRTT